jgi:hypothetical protein
MGTIKGKRQFNKINSDLNELYRRIKDETFQYKVASASFFAEKVEMLINNEVFKNFLTNERIGEIIEMANDLTRNLNLRDTTVEYLKKLIKRLDEISNKEASFAVVK